MHNYVNIDEGNAKESPPRVEPFVNQSGKTLNADNMEVFLSFQSLALYSTHRTPSREETLSNPIEIPRAQEESNALPNPIALEKAWFNVDRGAMDQTNILERKLVTARQDLEHNAKLYTDMANHYKGLKEEHAGCSEKFKELDAELAKKDYALVYAERVSAEAAIERQKLVTQLSQAKVVKFYCICKFLPTVVRRLFQIYEYKQSLSEPFNMAIQAGWGKGLAKGRMEEHILAALHAAEGFDAYSDKKLYPMYDKLFEKEYPYVMKVASGYRHFVVDLLKVTLLLPKAQLFLRHQMPLADLSPPKRLNYL
ncbi:hypothetical protein Tco_0702445 [Tanacetum coccineum]|uniref:Uncharacterized protein n=1 Tax=Tanacetum coccineum TaxID=301880 RepID=A0ABQ4XW04_9ASTR